MTIKSFVLFSIVLATILYSAIDEMSAIDAAPTPNSSFQVGAPISSYPKICEAMAENDSSFAWPPLESNPEVFTVRMLSKFVHVCHVHVQSYSSI